MYKLVWEDDFNIDGKVNEDIWNITYSGSGNGNDEKQFYTNRLDNVFCKDSLLHLVAKKEDFEEKHYTSGKITTFGKKSIKYGKIEILAKLPKGRGMWPALWMLGENIRKVGWPLCGEIDIMENVGRRHEEIHFSIHSKKYNHNLNTHQTHVVPISDVHDDFHKYTLVWDENSIEYYVDDKHYVTFTKGEDGRDTDKEGWPYEPPYFLIINLAVGGTFGGPIDDDIFPQTLLVDYIKVYEKDES